MDKVREFLRTSLEKRGLKMAAVSRDLGKNPTYIQQFLTKGSPRDLPEEVRRMLAEILDVSEAALRQPQERAIRANVVPFDRPARDTNRSHKIIRAPYSEPGARDLPVRGAAKGGPGGVFVDNGQIFDYVPRPGDLIGVEDAYAVYMVGESMEPRLYAGFTLNVNPNKPPRKGHVVVVQLQAAESAEREYIVKMFVKRDADTLVLRQLNPDKELRYPAAQVRAVHRVTGLTEGD